MEAISGRTDELAMDLRLQPESESSRFQSKLVMVCAAGLIVLAGLAAYSNSFLGPFIFDDLSSIPDNPTIRQLWPMWQVLAPPANGETVGGRPLLNLSFAINYGIHGVNVWGYHVTNLGIHLLNGLLLLGILLRTFQLPILRPRFGRAALGLAFVTALLWTVHPLQTESVTYIVQRAESLAAMFFLLVLYSVIRGWDSGGAWTWYGLAILWCWLGVGTKEILVTCPVAVLLYDWTFFGDSIREIWRRRWVLYLGLVSSWLMLGALVICLGNLGRTKDPWEPDQWSYLRTQPEVILHYLRLSFWPNPLCLDYDWPVANTLKNILPGVLVVGALFLATLKGLWSRQGWGYCGAWFFLILAPTSIVLPLSQIAFEHRMYLPLAGVVTLVAASAYVAGQRWLGREAWIPGVVVALLAAVVLGYLTFRRNEAYCSTVSIWIDTVSRAPHNARAHNSCSTAMVALNRYQEAIEHCETALRCDPRRATVHNNYGNILSDLGRYPEAIEHLNTAIKIHPDLAQPYYNLALALLKSGRLGQGIEQLRKALQLKPDYVDAQYNLGIALSQIGNVPEAIEHYQAALRIEPNHLNAHNKLAEALIGLGRFEEAIDHYQQALRIQPENAIAHHNLCMVLSHSGRFREAINHGNEAIRLLPHQPQVKRFVAMLLATHDPVEGGDPKQAVELAEHACVLTNRRDPVCLDTLAAAYASAGRFDEAVATANEARRLAEATGQKSLAEDIHMRLQLYRDRKPYREPAATTSKPSP